jgi:hypothetical protein
MRHAWTDNLGNEVVISYELNLEPMATLSARKRRWGRLIERLSLRSQRTVFNKYIIYVLAHHDELTKVPGILDMLR